MFCDDDDQGDGWQPEPTEALDFSESLPSLEIWRGHELETFTDEASRACLVLLQHDPAMRGELSPERLVRRVNQYFDADELIDSVMAKIDLDTIDHAELENELSRIPFETE